MRINIVVEGYSDSEAAKALVLFTGNELGKIVVKGGKSKLDRDLMKYNEAARKNAWVVFRDTDGECPVELRNGLISGSPKSPLFELRLAHTMTEAWLLADRVNFSQFFSVPLGKIPNSVDQVQHAKTALLSACSHSKHRKIREGMVRSNLKPGPLYTSILNDFARDKWDISEALEQSNSLSRAVRRLRMF